MSDLDLCIVDTGLSNLASIEAAFLRQGLQPRRVSTPVDLARATRLVLPGVGAFGAAMAELQRLGLVEVLVQRFVDERPTLAICLGMQLLAESSEESPGVEGLGVIAGRVERFGAGVSVPQLGWNEVVPGALDDLEMRGESNPMEASLDAAWLVERGSYCFANSYRLATAPSGWRAAYAEHGGRFVAALERGAQLACQFHPELSGALGARLIARWLALTSPALTSPAEVSPALPSPAECGPTEVSR